MSDEKQESGQETAKRLGTVTVGCKLPHGLWMELQVDDGPKTAILARGCNTSEVVGGFGLTPNVQKDFWDAWLEQHKNLKFVKNGQIWAYKSIEGAKAKAKEMAEIKHGMEALDPNNLPKGIEKADLK